MSEPKGDEPRNAFEQAHSHTQLESKTTEPQQKYPTPLPPQKQERKREAQIELPQISNVIGRSTCHRDEVTSVEPPRVSALCVRACYMRCGDGRSGGAKVLWCVVRVKMSRSRVGVRFHARVGSALSSQERMGMVPCGEMEREKKKTESLCSLCACLDETRQESPS